MTEFVYPAETGLLRDQNYLPVQTWETSARAVSALE
jgi:hypothetical protein